MSWQLRRICRVCWVSGALVGAIGFPFVSPSAQTKTLNELKKLGKTLKQEADKKAPLPEVNITPPPLSDEEKSKIGKQKALDKFDKQIELDALKGLTK